MATPSSPSSPALSGAAARGTSHVAWVPKAELGHPEWIAAGRQLGAIGRCSQWWVGDWIRYGNAKWGEKYAEAARITGYDAGSLRNMASVAACFDLSLRSDKLTWSHHVLLAPLERDEQISWINRAIEERFSVADLRVELRSALRCASTAPTSTNDLSPPDDETQALTIPIVCPSCGHTIAVAPDHQAPESISAPWSRQPSTQALQHHEQPHVGSGRVARASNQ